LAAEIELLQIQAERDQSDLEVGLGARDAAAQRVMELGQRRAEIDREKAELRSGCDELGAGTRLDAAAGSCKSCAAGAVARGDPGAVPRLRERGAADHAAPRAAAGCWGSWRII
jgi:hypothetical protein